MANQLVVVDVPKVIVVPIRASEERVATVVRLAQDSWQPSTLNADRTSLRRRTTLCLDYIHSRISPEQLVALYRQHVATSD